MPERSPAPSPDFALELDRVSKTYASGTVALLETSLTVQQGDFVALVGPSGCGKSTLLRLIAGLSAPSNGQVTTQAQGESDIGFVFQEPTLMPWASVFDNVALPLKLQGRATTDFTPEVTTALDGVALAEFSKAYPRELSGGMKMRVSIARALVSDPSLLLLDEPFAALDEFTRAGLNDDLLRVWAQRKWTGLFVTHSVREAVYLANRVLVMSARPGRVVADLEVPFTHPRQPDLRNDHAFTDFCATVSRALAQSDAT